MHKRDTQQIINENVYKSIVRNEFLIMCRHLCFELYISSLLLDSTVSYIYSSKLCTQLRVTYNKRHAVYKLLPFWLDWYIPQHCITSPLFSLHHVWHKLLPFVDLVGTSHQCSTRFCFAPCVIQIPSFCAWLVHPATLHLFTCHLLRHMGGTNFTLLDIFGTSLKAALVTRYYASLNIYIGTSLNATSFHICAVRDTHSTLDDNMCTSHKASRLHCHIPQRSIAFLLLHE